MQHRHPHVLGSSRPVFVISALALAVGCIMRTAPAGGPAATPTPPQSATVRAAEARIASVPRSDLLAGKGLKAFELHGDKEKVDLTPLAVEGQPFTEAVRVNIRVGSGSSYAVQLQALTATQIEEGDALLATFFLRTEKPQVGGVGQTELVLELAQPPYTKSIEYPIQGGADWSKVQVRFKASRAYQAGEAQMIFRLGYEPEIIDIGGVQVESFGKRVPMSALPSSQAADRKRERTAEAAAREAERTAAEQPPEEGGNLTFSVTPSKLVRPISPYIYGINSQNGEGTGITVRRMGGNRQTAYNWEINDSSAGSDYNHSSDDWACTAMGYRDCSQPAAQFLDFAQDNHRASVETIATIPLVDYVVADKLGSVPEADKAPSKRFVRSYPSRSAGPKPGPKTGPLPATPDLEDGAVYQDELVSTLVRKLGQGAQGGIKFYSLDNEPALWSSTHPRVHPERTRFDEMVRRSEATAAEILRVDPTAQVLGGVMFGWSEYLTLQDAPDAQEHLGPGKYPTYLDFFLASMRKLEDTHHP